MMNLNMALLLGAGFSRPSGIPLMHDLAINFPTNLEGEDKLTYLQLYELLPEITEDFELLMQVCHDLKNMPVELINRLINRSSDQQLLDFAQLVNGAESLDRCLKHYLHQHCQIQKDQIAYLYPFAHWLKLTGTQLDIFSVNYDLVVESLCEEFFLTYTDGFLVNWQPELFSNPTYQIRLYKLHGSFVWYQSVLGERVKIPILNYDNTLNYLANDRINSMMVYPKREKREPFQELLQIFRKKLLTLDRLIIIGYSLRDQELTEIIVRGMQKNQNLIVELISPEVDELARGLQMSERLESFAGGVEEWIQARFSQMIAGCRPQKKAE